MGAPGCVGGGAVRVSAAMTDAERGSRLFLLLHEGGATSVQRESAARVQRWSPDGWLSLVVLIAMRRNVEANSSSVGPWWIAICRSIAKIVGREERRRAGILKQ